MCRAEVTGFGGCGVRPAAGRDALCEQTGTDPALALIGPVDFGDETYAFPPHARTN